MARFAHHFELGLVVVSLLVVRPRRGAACDTERVALRRVRERKSEGAVRSHVAMSGNASGKTSLTNLHKLSQISNIWLLVDILLQISTIVCTL